MLPKFIFSQRLERSLCGWPAAPAGVFSDRAKLPGLQATGRICCARCRGRQIGAHLALWKRSHARCRHLPVSCPYRQTVSWTNRIAGLCTVKPYTLVLEKLRVGRHLGQSNPHHFLFDRRTNAKIVRLFPLRNFGIELVVLLLQCWE
jgi:hypothetical protein